jgi:hypothetical protein
MRRKNAIQNLRRQNLLNLISDPIELIKSLIPVTQKYSRQVLAASREHDKSPITFTPTDDTGIWIRGSESLAYT